MSDINKNKLFIPITESEQSKKGELFIPRRLSGENSRFIQWNKEQPIVDGERINQYTHDGKKIGIWEEYYNGQLMSKGLYKNGNRDGIWELYHDNGQLESKGLFKDDLKEGIWEFYHDNGQLYSKSSFNNGKQDGIWEYYYDNGQLEMRGLYKDDLKDGIWEEYYKNGQLESKSLYKNNRLIKKLPLTESEQSKKGKLFIPRRLSGENSRFIQWNKEQPVVDGVQINQFTHNGKKEGYWEEVDENNFFRENGYYKNGKKDGVWKYLDFDFMLLSEGTFKDDKKNGIWKYYWRFDGSLKLKGLYKDDIKTGIWEFYYYDEQLDSKGQFKNDKKDGIWEEYFPNGGLKSKKLFDDGKLIKELPITESKTPSFLLKEEMGLIREGNVQDYINNVISKIKNLPYETKKKYLLIAISTLLGYTSYPVIQSMFDKSPDKETKEIVHRVMNKKDNFSMFKDGTKFRLSKKGFQHIMDEEKPKLIAYALGDGKITVGYGHAEPVETTKLKVGQKITKEQAKLYLKQDLKIAADGVRRMFNDWKKQDKNYKVTQDMFDALVSMAFNMGVSGLRNTNLVDHLRDGDYKTAGQLIKQTNIDNDSFPGLEKRRNKESNMFLSYLLQKNKINV